MCGDFLFPKKERQVTKNGLLMIGATYDKLA